MNFKKLLVVLVTVFIGIATVTVLYYTVGLDRVINAETTGNDDHDGHDYSHENDDSHAEEGHEAENSHEHDHDDDLGHKADDDHDHDHEAEASSDDDHDRAHDDENVIHIEKEEIAEFGIKMSVAEPGLLRISLEATGEVLINPDRLSHIVPYISGVVLDVRKRLGDNVRKRETMAVIESRELSDLQSTFLVAREKLNLSKTMYLREKKLWEKSISSEKEYLVAQQSQIEAEIELEAAGQKLHALVSTMPT